MLPSINYMAMGNPKLHVFIAVIILSLSSNSVYRCSATLYQVGDTSGWDISTNLDSWVQDKSFRVGDVLWFQYSSYHSVSVLTKKDYDGCNTSNALLTSTSGNTTIPLTKPGDRYFACGNNLHCLAGMKLHVHVDGAGSPVGAPQAAKGPISSIPGSSKNNNPAIPSSATLPFVNGGSVLLLLVLFVFQLLIDII